MPRRAVLALAAAAVLATAGPAAAEPAFITPFATAPGTARLAPDGGGGVLLAVTRSSTDGRRVAVMRLRPDGTLDPAFAAKAPTPGVAVAGFGDRDASALAVGAGPDGSVVVAAAVDGGLAGVARLSSAGAPIVAGTSLLGLDLTDAAVDSAGRVVFAGSRFGVPLLARVLPNGVVDPSFAWEPPTGALGAVGAVRTGPGDEVFALRRDRVERLTAGGAPVAGWSGALPWAGRTLSVDASGGAAVAGAPGLVRLTPADGSAVASFGVVPLIGVSALTPGCDGDVVAAGPSLVRVDAAGAQAAPRALLSPGATSVVVSSGSLVVAGTIGDTTFAQQVPGAVCTAIQTIDGVAPPAPSRVVSGGESSSSGPSRHAPVAGVTSVILHAREATRIRRAGEVVRLPPAARCVQGRRMAIRIDVPEGAAVVDVTLRVDGRRSAVRLGKGRWSTVHLTGLPHGRFAVEAAVRLADETVLRSVRRYRSCSA